MRLCARILIFAIALSFSIACQRPEAAPVASGFEGWLTGSTDEKFDVVANHLRGFDMAMVETGYRYTTLYFAGEDRNWEFANYQATKIKVAIENGLQRRPRRAASAQPFLSVALPAVINAIGQKDTAAFRKSFDVLTATCNSCHVAEKLGFMTVGTPTARLTPMGRAAASPSPGGQLP
jgi:hypothetical protein